MLHSRTGGAMRCVQVRVVDVGVLVQVMDRVWGFRKGRNLEYQVWEMWQSLSVGARWKSSAGPVWRSEVVVVEVSLVCVQDVRRPRTQSKSQVEVGELISRIEEGRGVMAIGDVGVERDSGADTGFCIWI